MKQEIVHGHINRVINNIVFCTMLYATADGIKPTGETLPLEFFSWVPQDKDTFDVIVDVDEDGNRTINRVICTNMTEQETLERNISLTKLHDLDREWTIEEINDYIDEVMLEISEEIRNKNA